MKIVKLNDRVRHRGINGLVCSVSATDQTCVVRYDGKPPRFSPWVSWEVVEVLPLPAEGKAAS